MKTNRQKWWIAGLVALLLALVCAVALAEVEVNEDTFPDETFRNYVLTNFDSDQSLSLSDDEIAAVDYISLSTLKYSEKGKITTLQGIEYFTELVELECSFLRSITSLDLNQNTKLEYLTMSMCSSLTSLQISKCTGLVALSFPSVPISSIDVSCFPNLKCLVCSSTDITTLDITKNPILKELVATVELDTVGEGYMWERKSDGAKLNIDQSVKLITEIQVTGITLSKTKETLTRTGKTPKPTLTLTAKVSPADADNPAVTWSSDKPKVAKVDENGKITALSKGTAVITCTAKDGSGVKATCTVTVKDALVTKITLNKTKATLKVGKTLKLKVKKFAPASPLNSKVKWTSNKPKIAKVDKNGKVTALKKGTAIITCAAQDGSKKKATCKITVKEK